MEIRSTSKAIIVNQNKILLNKCYDENNGEYYGLPGGGQNRFETMTNSVVRECLEETGYLVRPLRLVAICEEICESIPRKDTIYGHKILHIFACELVNETKVRPVELDSMQIGIEWVELEKLEGIRILPEIVGKNILKIIDQKEAIFLGSTYIEHNHG